MDIIKQVKKHWPLVILSLLVGCNIATPPPVAIINQPAPAATATQIIEATITPSNTPVAAPVIANSPTAIVVSTATLAPTTLPSQTPTTSPTQAPTKTATVVATKTAIPATATRVIIPTATAIAIATAIPVMIAPTALPAPTQAPVAAGGQVIQGVMADGAPFWGNPNAPVVLHDYSDFL